VCATLLMASTRVDLKSQAINADFGSFTMTRPFQTGTSLPSTCVGGDMFFKTDATAGSNLYGCTSTNTWKAQGSTSQGSSAPQATTGFSASRTSNTVLTIGDDCTSLSPCKARFGSAVFSYTGLVTVTVTSGTGTILVYVNNNGSLAVGRATNNTPAVSCSGCQLETPMSQFPIGAIPLFSWTATLGTWDATGVDQRATLSAGQRLTAGSNITLTETGSMVSISANGLPQGSIVNGAALRLGGSVSAGATTSLLGLGNALSGGHVDGTVLGVNTESGFGGDLANWMNNSSSMFRVSGAGQTIARKIQIQDPAGNTLLQVQAGSGQSTDLAAFSSAAGLTGARVSQNGALVNLPFGTKPGCSSSVRGMLWHTQGGTGVADLVEVCAKNAADAYIWTALF
jgi:hypothetical protein